MVWDKKQIESFAVSTTLYYKYYETVLLYECPYLK